MPNAEDTESLLDGEELSQLEAEGVSPKSRLEQSLTQQVTVKLKEVIDGCKNNLDFLAAFLLPDIFKYNFSHTFTQLWTLVTSKLPLLRDFTKIAVGLPRGLGKTTVIKLLIMYILFFTDRHFICLYSSREGLAVNILTDIKSMLATFNVKATFGDYTLAVETNTKQELNFAFRGRNIIIMALGAGTSMRGINLNNRRPDVMLFDDIQTSECAKSDVESESLETWMVGTAMKAKDNERCLYIYLGNMYPRRISAITQENTCILSKLKHNPEWISFIAGGILADGTSIWEEMKPLQAMIDELRSDIAMGHPEIFFAEVLNDETAGQKSGIDINKVPHPPFIEGVDLPEGRFIVIDPASGKISGDNVEICLVEVFSHKPVIKKFLSGKFSPGETIKNAISLALHEQVSVIAVEDTAYQSTLLYWFGIVSQQIGLQGIEFVPISPRGRSKVSRIITMLKQLIAGEIYLHDLVRAAVFFEIGQFDPTKVSNLDNKLDCVAYSQDVMEENQYTILTPLSVEYDEYDKSAVLSLEENSVF